MANEAALAEKTPAKVSSKEGKYLTFTLSDEVYGIDILKIKEIIGMMDITSIPQTPDYVKGVINLRGKVIPVVDLRLKFGMPAKEYDARTCIIVVEVSGGKEGSLQMGIVVDSVREVVNLKADQMEPPPTFGSRLETDFIMSMAKMDKMVIILLDIDRVMGAAETEALAALT